MKLIVAHHGIFQSQNLVQSDPEQSGVMRTGKAGPGHKSGGKEALSMLRIVKWRFPQNNPYMFQQVIVIGKRLMISSLLSDSWQWSIVGLGLTKAERILFGSKPFEFRGILNIYLGKWIVSYNRDGYKKHMRGVAITADRVLF